MLTKKEANQKKEFHPECQVIEVDHKKTAYCCYHNSVELIEEEKVILESLAKVLSKDILISLNHIPGTYLLKSAKSICSFTNPDNGKCSLEEYAIKKKKHPWLYKPIKCCFYPVHPTGHCSSISCNIRNKCYGEDGEKSSYEVENIISHDKLEEFLDLMSRKEFKVPHQIIIDRNLDINHVILRVHLGESYHIEKGYENRYLQDIENCLKSRFDFFLFDFCYSSYSRYFCKIKVRGHIVS